MAKQRVDLPILDRVDRSVGVPGYRSIIGSTNLPGGVPPVGRSGLICVFLKAVIRCGGDTSAVRPVSVNTQFRSKS